MAVVIVVVVVVGESELRWEAIQFREVCGWGGREADKGGVTE